MELYTLAKTLLAQKRDLLRGAGLLQPLPPLSEDQQQRAAEAGGGDGKRGRHRRPGAEFFQQPAGGVTGAWRGGGLRSLRLAVRRCRVL